MPVGNGPQMGVVDGAGARGEDAGVRIAFVDESGDVGGIGSPTRHFVLVALVVEHASWAAVNAELSAMRERLHRSLELRLDAEIHASAFLSRQPSHLGLSIRSRFLCAHHMLRTLSVLPGTGFRRVAIAKAAEGRGVFDIAWENLLYGVARIPSPGESSCPSKGLVVVCDHHGARPYIPSERVRSMLPESSQLLDLPYGRDSADNSVLQMSDLLAYLTKQSIEPNAFFSKSRNQSILHMTDDLFGGPCQVISS